MTSTSTPATSKSPNYDRSRRSESEVRRLDRAEYVLVEPVGDAVGARGRGHHVAVAGIDRLAPTRGSRCRSGPGEIAI